MSDELALTLNRQLDKDIAALIGEGVSDAVVMLSALRTRAQWRDAGFTLAAIERRMRALTGDTTQFARQIVRARSAQTMLEVLDDGEPRDKIQVLAKWGPEPNVEDSRGSLTIVVGGSANVQINIGTPQPIVVENSLTESK